MRVFVLFCSALMFAVAAQAQTFEAGGRVAAGCIGSDGSMCGNGTNPLAGGHFSLWPNERVELSAVVARTWLDRIDYRVDNIDVFVTDRKRDFVSFLFVYHFLEGKPVRPMLGIGSGWYADASRTGCQPAGCQTVLRGGPLLGQYRDWDIDAVFVVGLSSVVKERWAVRGGWQSHRFANDENSTQQFFAAIGYRFGR